MIKATGDFENLDIKAKTFDRLYLFLVTLNSQLPFSIIAPKIYLRKAYLKNQSLTFRKENAKSFMIDLSTYFSF